MMRIFSFLGGIVLFAACCVWIAWATSPDPEFNPASFEDDPLTVEVAPFSIGYTLAQATSPSGAVVTLLVTALEGDEVVGVDLALLGAPRVADPFAAFSAIDRSEISAVAARPENLMRLSVDALAPAGPLGDRHVAVGTNFPEHAEEASSDEVFLFPKFGVATPAVATVAAASDGLLDYEIELCMRFDRPIATLADFDAAEKGVFLCGDFTERKALLELADPDDLDSGYGFSDAKSGAGYFPTGPFLVIPNDWRSFVRDVRMMTFVNGQARQDARGGEMILDFRQLAEKALSDMTARRFFYDGEFYRLAPEGVIAADMTLMSGTSEGVIFTMPTRRDYIDAVATYLRAGGPFGEKPLVETGVATFIGNEIASGHYLQPGDVVDYRALWLGAITVEVTD